MKTEDAVAHGIKSTAGVVTSAAIVMVAVFSMFALSSELQMKQMGIGLAAAILIDATIIRGVLLPATMKLLGDWNWWLPSRLNWLPKLQSEPEVQPEQRARPERHPGSMNARLLSGRWPLGRRGASSTAASAWIRVVGKPGTGLSFWLTRSSISVQPRITPWGSGGNEPVNYFDVGLERGLANDHGRARRRSPV